MVGGGKGGGEGRMLTFLQIVEHFMVRDCECLEVSARNLQLFMRRGSLALPGIEDRLHLFDLGVSGCGASAHLLEGVYGLFQGRDLFLLLEDLILVLGQLRGCGGREGREGGGRGWPKYISSGLVASLGVNNLSSSSPYLAWSATS